MKKVSSVALVAALMVGFGGASLATPAFARKEDAPKGPTLSPAVRTAALAAQRALAAQPRDLTTAESSLAQIDAAKKNDDEKYIADAIRIAIQENRLNALPENQRRYADEAATLDSLIANPVTPKSDLGRFLYARANLAYNAHQYDVAGKLYARARDAGYQDANLLVNLAKAEMEAGQTQQAATDMDAAIKAEQAAGRKAPEGWYHYTIARLYRAKETDGALAWSRAMLTNYGTKENWRDTITSFGFQGAGAKRMTDSNLLDLYRLMHATHSLGGQKEWVDYANAASKAGLPVEAKSVTDEGRTAGIIPAGTVAAVGSAPAKSRAAPVKGAVGTGTGDALLGAREYAKAADKYRAALAGASDPDTVNLHLGIALAGAGDKAGAQAAFGAVKSGANLDIAKLWTTYLLTPPAA